jgi:hypothetical protein
MKKKKLKIWLSATSILEAELHLIKNVLLKRYTVIYSNDLIENSGENFNEASHLAALKQCDLFLGVINPKLKTSNFIPRDIYLKEIEYAMSLEKPYWCLVHRDVTFTRNLLKDLVLNDEKNIESKNKYFFDIRTIEIYKEILNQSNFDTGFHPLIDFFRLNELLGKLQQSIYNEKRSGQLKMMFASTVYGFEDQLSKIIEDLKQNEFNVLNSFYGSIQVNPKLSNLDNCIQAVHDTHWFSGLVRPYYGTGNINEKNITFEEINTAIKLQKPRWFYIHRDVIFASRIMEFIEVKKVLIKDGDKNTVSEKNILHQNNHIDSETIELYNRVTKDHEKDLKLRNGNWAQEFYSFTEAEIYIKTQFSDYTFIDKLINNAKNER